MCAFRVYIGNRNIGGGEGGKQSGDIAIAGIIFNGECAIIPQTRFGLGDVWRAS